MDIVFKKAATKNSITCTRIDGSSTWQEVQPFLILHDLTHYAVETSLGTQQGFYGLLQEGLDITDFEKKQKVTPRSLPAEAIRTEILVTLFLTELNDQQPLKDFNRTFAETSQSYGLEITPLMPDQLAIIRTRRDNLIKKWKNLPMGSTLALRYPAT
jgi:hypothetical protein